MRTFEKLGYEGDIVANGRHTLAAECGPARELLRAEQRKGLPCGS